MKLLIEIGVEELPAIPFLKEYKNIAPKWSAVLEKYRLQSEFSFEFTPRRFVICHENFASTQSDSLIVQTGAPKSVALKDGAWSKAALSFASKCGISESELKFKEIDGKEVLYFESVQKGEPSKSVLGAMIEEFLGSLNFGRAMRWGEGKFEFIRPLRSVACLLGNDSVEFEIYGVKSELAFFPHRSFGYEKVKFTSAEEYFALLEKHGVILSAQKRKEKILAEFKEIESANGVTIEIDEDLLSEVVAITEHPTALLGSFEAEFLAVPKEVIITSMKENQRYFPVFKNGKLSNHFVVASNAITDDNSLIVRGNEKVLRARLSDAMFFWQSDLKSGLNPEKLKSVSYLSGLGSIYDKQVREISVAKEIAKFWDKELKAEFGGDYTSALEEAIMLSKADLLSTMVGEFSELQGIMGSYYAAHAGKDKLISRAIYEQYLPNSEDSELPAGVFSSLVAVATKFESLAGLFSINKIPSGNKDPYALRRAAAGIIKIVQNLGLNLDLGALVKNVAVQYSGLDSDKLLDFIKDRLYAIYDVNPSIIKACLNSGEDDIKALGSAIMALDKISKDDKFKDNFDTFKRLSNIIKDEKIGAVDEALFQNEAESELNSAFKAISVSQNEPESYLNALFGLKDKIDMFFEKVMINVDDKAIRANRIANVGQIYNAFKKIADIKEISF
ncbi:glycine--tRNA ligase subunit beta [Campylobacter sp. VBCF_06 NA8]|uniref:glycine--tRNA ligase subunit beta n=1 Tax=unclassified Campylobacter TaxID=2593542 RepID=UPI0022E9F965|nr:MULTISPECIES: glycine--tRNA ligase subunit beta [unclassified Campylobacter]MDA3043450.1 glycine--tRNA ligase subunit beta [Campylobacter sp. JMF_09 ED2]MDA3045204.1 glycine--tRNA ligase subunit beta [Campylobacter sp. JMF_07 ED4]MDA3046069.1 glycine--tRNA ligase subunit beta [Campylobacter sp. VBCF_06 NA8]MDA3064196.1 glycine--tRNA ligase subunit beta [Campylobacter sp. JMF_11 EL3]MDA3071932.1 glycine--tRNA ligase subunit beta [Campylobacter sp. VBCF_03 NA9]